MHANRYGQDGDCPQRSIRPRQKLDHIGDCLVNSTMVAKRERYFPRAKDAFARSIEAVLSAKADSYGKDELAGHQQLSTGDQVWPRGQKGKPACLNI